MLEILPAGNVKLHGPLGLMLDNVIENRLKKLDWAQMVRPFRERNERDGRWRCEFWGKVVRSAVYAWRSTQDPELREMIDRTVADLLSTQTEDGCISSYPAELQLGGWDIWGRKYVLLALLVYYREMNPDPAIPERIRRLVRHLLGQTGERIQDHGYHYGMAAASILRGLVEAGELCGDPEILAAAEKLAASGCCQVHDLFHAARIGVLPSELGNGKAYEMTSCFQGLGALHERTADPLKLESLRNYYRLVCEKELFITGGGGLKDINGEFWYGGAERQMRTDCGGMGETCVTATWLWFSSMMLRLTGESTVADDMERIFCNALLGAFTPDGSGVMHINPFLAGGWKKQVGDQIPGFRGHDCCRAQGPYGLSLAPLIAVMKTDAGYAVNLYEDLTVRDVLEIRGGYPAADQAVITLLREGEFELALRIPRDFGCHVDGQAVPGGVYHVLKRNWRIGDTVRLEFDFTPRTETRGGWRATLCGPLVMCRESGAAKDGAVLRRSGPYVDYASAGRRFSEDNTLTVWEPV